MITQKEVLSLLDYNPTTGNLYWKVSKNNRIKVGDKAGSLTEDGYWKVMIHRKKYYAHRLIWFMVHGCFPTGQIDHINGNRLDNRIENLRDSTNGQNQANKFKRPNCSSQYKGVSFNKQKGQWRSLISFENKRFFLGYFDSEKEAALMYNEAALKLYKDYSRLNEVT